MYNIFSSLTKSTLKHLGYEIRRIQRHDIANNNPIIFVYQMGKAASASIRSGIDKTGLGHISTHHISENNLKYYLQVIQNASPNYAECVRRYLHHVEKGNWFRNRIMNRTGNLKIITTFREPISYFISAFFQNYEPFFEKRIQEVHGVISSDTVIKYIEKHINEVENYQDMSLDHVFSKYEHPAERNFFFLIWNSTHWFQSELEENYKITPDMFLNSSKGPYIYRDEDIEILVLRFGDFSHWEESIQSFLGAQEFKLPRENMGENKSYSSIYNDVRTRINYPSYYLEAMMESQYTKAFFSSEEIQDIRAKYA